MAEISEAERPGEGAVFYLSPHDMPLPDSSSESSEEGDTPVIAETCREDVRRAAGILLPGLADELVAEEVWPRMFIDPSLSLLFRLRRVSRSWFRFVESQLEWQALDFIRLDNPGYQLYVRQHGFSRVSLTQRLRKEIECLQMMGPPGIAVEAPKCRSRWIGLGSRRPARVLRYASIVGCPPDFEQESKYYDL